MDAGPILSGPNTGCQTLGSVTTKRLPLPGVLSTAIVPCSSSTLRRTKASPNPIPTNSRANRWSICVNGWNRWASALR